MIHPLALPIRYKELSIFKFMTKPAMESELLIPPFLQELNQTCYSIWEWSKLLILLSIHNTLVAASAWGCPPAADAQWMH